MQVALEEQTQRVQALSTELEDADSKYKELLDNLHTDVVGAPSGQPPRVPLSKLLEGDLSCFDLGECETLFGLVDSRLYEVTEDDQKQAAERREKMQKGIAELAQTLFGSAKQFAEKLNKEHAEH
eukprot:3324966-Pyramimonas_sp.AAC.1